MNESSRRRRRLVAGLRALGFTMRKDELGHWEGLRVKLSLGRPPSRRTYRKSRSRRAVRQAAPWLWPRPPWGAGRN